MKAEAFDAGLVQYRKERQEFFAKHGYRCRGTLADAFDVLAPLPLSSTQCAEILEATKAVGCIYQRVSELLRQSSDEVLARLGVPEGLLGAVRGFSEKTGPWVIARVDLVHTDEGYKLLELNADVPGMLVETFRVNSLAAQFAAAEDPNTGGEALLKERLAIAVQAGTEGMVRDASKPPNVVVTSVCHFARDTAIAHYVCELLGPDSTSYVPVDHLRLEEDGLYDAEGSRIDVLYRMVSLDSISSWLIVATKGKAATELLLRLVRERKLVMINPPSSFLMESKALQAAIWGLVETGAFFSEAERAMVLRFMLPTYLDRPTDDGIWVEKPMYGAEGDSIRILGSGDSVIEESVSTGRREQAMVYQKYVPVPPYTLMTEFGERTLRVLTSCFLLGDRAAGISMRAGGTITDSSAWVLPTVLDP